MSRSLVLDPTRVSLFERDTSSTYPTDSNGCVICPSNEPCPKCKDNEVCHLSVQSCNSCASAFCVPNNVSSGGGTNVGAIAGGVVGGVVFVLLLVAGYLYYKCVYRKKSIMLDDDKDIVLSGMNNDNESVAYSISNMESNIGDPKLEAEYSASRVRPVRPEPNRRLSSYESFTRPKRPRARKTASRNRTGGSNRNPSNGQLISDNASSRNSIATTISTTDASNILPIAYIPGVTVRPTKNNTRSIYSYDSESIFSDLNTIENASIVGDVVRAKNLQGRETKNTTTTAIKAQPRLVNVDRIEEEDEDEDEEEGEEEDTDHPNVDKSNSSDPNTTFNLNGSTLSVLPIQITKSGHESDDDTDSDIDGDSDVDSDIGEIARATSVRKTENEKKESETPEQSEDIYVEISQLDGNNHIPIQQAPSATNGGFVIDLAIESDQESETSKSPFDDP